MPAPQYLNGQDKCQGNPCKLSDRDLTKRQFYVVEIDIPRVTHVECANLYTQAQVDAKVKDALDKKPSGWLNGFICGVVLVVLIGLLLYNLPPPEQERTSPTGRRPPERRF